jgi:tetratricopeptide (TPR) repeat protein
MIENVWNWNHVQCESELRKALELNPGNALALAKYATTCLGPLGRYEEAFEYLSRARELDPTSITIHTDFALNLWFRGQVEQFKKEAKMVIEMDPRNLRMRWFYTAALGHCHDWSAAAEQAEIAVSLAPDDLVSRANAAWAHRVCGNLTRSSELCGRLKVLAAKGYVPGWVLAISQVGSAPAESTFDLLTRAVAEREPMVRFLHTAFPLMSLRTDSRWINLFSRAGVPDR